VRRSTSKDKKNFFVSTALLIPLVIALGELFSAGLIGVDNFLFPSKGKIISHKTLPDLVTGGIRFAENIKDKNINESFVDKHGLIKTTYISDSKINNNIRGILITGNSVAMGYPLTSTGDYHNTFVNRLERDLRLKDESIDIVNLSFPGNNSWQENIQLARYFNSEKTHYDLPSKIDLIASLGGIQDFWGFIGFIYDNKNKEKNNYYEANGFMSVKLHDVAKKDLLIFWEKSAKALDGNIKAGIEMFSHSLIINIRKNSNIYRLVRSLMIRSSALKVNSSKVDNDINNEILNKPFDLSHIVTQKLNITLNEYQIKKEVVIESVSRNIKSILALQAEPNVLFVYLPTRFGSSDVHENLEHRFFYRDLSVKDLGVLERDYRDALTSKLSLINGVRVINLSTIGEDFWFADESHYSLEGHHQIALNLVPIFDDLLRLK
tara:strand:+ start:1708 stop:3012 length:1305 start_codon:yes stop_codon:yes gene_type:complete